MRVLMGFRTVVPRAVKNSALRVALRMSILAVACLLFLSACDAGNTTGLEDIDKPAENPILFTPESDLRFSYYRDVYPDKELILLLEGDCNEDGITDMVIVYRENSNKNHQVTVYSHEADYRLTKPIPAPYEDCMMEWNNRNDHGHNNLVVSGRRGANYGLSVYHFKNGEWVDLYGGMEECC